VSYWREGNLEVDFVLQQGEQLVALEVKSNRKRDALPGLAAFTKAYPGARTLLAGGQGIPLQEFLEMPVSALFE
jgi:hypothetical protein